MTILVVQYLIYKIVYETRKTKCKGQDKNI